MAAVTRPSAGSDSPVHDPLSPQALAALLAYSTALVARSKQLLATSADLHQASQAASQRLAHCDRVRRTAASGQVSRPPV